MFKIIKFLISMLQSLVRWFASDKDKPVEPNNRAKRRREYNDYRKRKAVELKNDIFIESTPDLRNRRTRKTIAKISYMRGK
jgi:hypothetical protein